MKAVAHYQKGEISGKTQNGTCADEMKRCAEKIWNTISRYVTLDHDAVFKDPNWPYLWDKKK